MKVNIIHGIVENFTTRGRKEREKILARKIIEIVN